jgi:hypothetical protein
MFKKLLDKFNNWNELRKINHWSNWEFIGYEWKTLYKSDTHEYQVHARKCINIITGEIQLRDPYYHRARRFRSTDDCRVVMLGENVVQKHLYYDKLLCRDIPKHVGDVIIGETSTTDGLDMKICPVLSTIKLEVLLKTETYPLI